MVSVIKEKKTDQHYVRYEKSGKMIQPFVQPSEWLRGFTVRHLFRMSQGTVKA